MYVSLSAGKVAGRDPGALHEDAIRGVPLSSAGRGTHPAQEGRTQVTGWTYITNLSKLHCNQDV